MTGKSQARSSRIGSPWLLLLVASAVLATASPATAAPGDTVADRVLGQPNLYSAAPYFVDGRVFGAAAVAFDRSSVPNRVYVADAESNRVLGWADERGFLRGAPADLVLGQPDLSTGGITYDPHHLLVCAPPSATTLCDPAGIAVDRAGNLYVVDRQNSRVLEFDRPFDGDRRADRVFGQPDLSSNLDFQNGGLGWPEIALDPADNLFILERAGSPRLLAYANPVERDTRPDAVVEGADYWECNAGTAGLRLCSPSSLAVDPAGTLYVLDYDPALPAGPAYFLPARLLAYRHPLAERLRLSFTLELDTNAGSPPAFGGLATDAAGSLFLQSDDCIGRIAAPIGTGSALECVIALPRLAPIRLAFDTQGRLFAAQFYLADIFFNQLLKFEPPFTQASLPQIVSSPRRTPRSLYIPYAVAVDTSTTPNRLYAADFYQRVLGWRDAAGFASGAPADLVIGARGGHIPEAQANCGPPAADRFCFGKIVSTAGLAVDAAGNLWVADSDNNRVLEFDRPFETDGVADRVLGQRDFSTGSPGDGSTGFSRPGALAVDRQGNLYVADVHHARVLLFRDPLRTDAIADRVFGARDRGLGGQCSHPSKRGFCLGLLANTYPGIIDPLVGLAVDGEGNLYVADGGNSRVLIFEDAARSDTVADHVLGQDGRFDTFRLGVSARRFSTPGGLAVGQRGELYVADVYSSRVLEFDHPLQGGAADRVFGQKDFTSSDVLAPPTPSSLQFPRGVAVDAEGNLYVADTVDHRVTAYDQP